MSLACLSLSAGEASMEALELELEAVESQIRSLETKREGIRALLLTRTRSSEVSVRYNDNLPVSSTPRVSLSRPSAPRTRCTQASFTPTPGYHGPWVQPRKVLARSRAERLLLRCSRSPRRTASPLSARRVAMLPSLATQSSATSAPLPPKIPTILSAAESLGAAVLHVGTNDTGLRQTEILKKDFRSLIETVRRASPATQIIVSGPLPTYRRGNERFSRLFALNEWLLTWCEEQKLLFANNWNLFWERPRLFRADGLHPSRAGAELLSDNITRILRSI
ncbi:uncharacterized protein LOC130246163 [Danio aesculapii]|uniref:uncharacterized protein LOC130246163 n=1 Tax=Danio aesculapii TaxID=1142201 RepID=UPI0024BF86A3|nr:uncharacterized protein LOC130246163 [Danio aesculapii]XP_056335032.1 uncharacterized protein LOC130246163 [Danio aesculapii]